MTTKRQFVSQKGDTWEWDETPETRKAIKKLQMDIDERIRQLEKESPDYGVGKVKLKSYEEQRKDRLADAIEDYLNDQNVTSSELYLEMKDVVIDWEKYHQEQAQKSQQVVDFMCGRLVPNKSMQNLTHLTEWESYRECCKSLEYLGILSEDSEDS